MPKNICLNSFSHSCFRMTFFIRHLVLILFKMELLKEKIDTFFKPLELYCFKCTCPSISEPMLFPLLVFLINRMPSSVLDWVTPFQTIFPHKSLFPIEPRVFGWTCFVRDVRLHVSKLLYHIETVETKRRIVGGKNSLYFPLSHHTYIYEKVGYTLGKIIYSS